MAINNIACRGDIMAHVTMVIFEVMVIMTNIGCVVMVIIIDWMSLVVRVSMVERSWISMVVKPMMRIFMMINELMSQVKSSL